MGKIINGCPVSPAKQELLTLLGAPWTMQRIDFEPCVYRDLGLYDIEISGGRTKKADINIYVWEKRPRLYVVEQHMGLHYGEDEIKAICDDIVDRLGVETDQTYTEIVKDGYSRMELKKTDMWAIRDLNDACDKADVEVDSVIRTYILELGIRNHDRWWEKRKNSGMEMIERAEKIRREHPEVYIDTEKWSVFLKKEEEMKNFIQNLPARKRDDLLCVVRLGKHLENHEISILCARDFRNSIGVESRPDDAMEREYRKVLDDPYNEKLNRYIRIAADVLM